jgi:hypothetical protein
MRVAWGDRVRGLWRGCQIREAAEKSEIPNDVYEAELFRLQTEYVKLQELVRLRPRDLRPGG